MRYDFLINRSMTWGIKPLEIIVLYGEIPGKKDLLQNTLKWNYDD